MEIVWTAIVGLRHFERYDHDDDQPPVIRMMVYRLDAACQAHSLHRRYTIGGTPNGSI